MPTGIYKRIKKRSGWKLTKETKEKMRQSHLGNKQTEITKKKIRQSHKGKKHKLQQGFQKGHRCFVSKETYKKRIGEKFSKSHKKRISKALKGRQPKNSLNWKGKNHPNWQNGKSFELYGIEFNTQLKEQIRKRDNYRCQECRKHQNELYSRKSKKYKLNIHHIDYNKKNNNPNNLISLCRNCHTKTNHKRKEWIRYFQQK